MYILILIIVSLIMAGLLQAAFKNMEIPGGYWNRLVGAVIGALLGELILGDWGWVLAGFNVFAGVIGSFLIGWLYITLYDKYLVKKSNQSE
jgi:uncharacterized membrane protein YeaQ/YmgE (transglycosylase-associated protein family)